MIHTCQSLHVQDRKERICIHLENCKKLQKKGGWEGSEDCSFRKLCYSIFSNAVQGYSKKVGMNVNLYDADYNQIDAQLLDRNSEVLKFEPDNIILWLGTEKIYEEFLDINLEERNGFADMYIQKILHYWELIEKNSHARIIQLNFCEIDDKVMGNYSCKVESTFIYQIRKLNFCFRKK